MDTRKLLPPNFWMRGDPQLQQDFFSIANLSSHPFTEQFSNQSSSLSIPGTTYDIGQIMQARGSFFLQENLYFQCSESGCRSAECSKEQSNSGGGGNNVSLGLLRDGTKSGEKGIRKEKAFSWALKWQVEVNQLDQVNQEESWLHLQKKEHALKVLRHVVGSFWHCTCLREAAVWCMGLCWKADREQSLWGLVCVLIGVYLDSWDKRVVIRFTFDLPHTPLSDNGKFTNNYALLSLHFFRWKWC